MPHEDADPGEPGISIHDVATAAVDGKDGGGPVDEGVRSRVEAHLGADLSGVRVHTDPLARQSTAAMGARAFAFGSDVFLGPGESGTDIELMAHELTHVVQQGAARMKATQAKLEVGAADSPAEAQADAVAASVAGGAAPTALIVEAAPVAPQVTKAAFLADLKTQILASATEVLGSLWAIAGCPYIESWFASHASDPATTIEAMAKRYSGLTTAVAPTDYLPPILARLRGGILRWRDGQDVGGELSAFGLAGAAQAATATQPGPAGAAPGTAQAKLGASSGASPNDIARELGPGAPLDGNTAARMGDAFGEDFSQVRIHTDVQAARKASEVNAAAFAVGHDVVFAGGQYQPGTPVGDAMLAHELAHVVQQKRADDDEAARDAPIGAESSAHEADADSATVGVMQRLYGGAKAAAARVKPALTSDFQMQRCQTNAVEGLMGADFEGAWLGEKVGETNNFAGFSEIHTDIDAERTLGRDDTEAAAIARVKTNGKPGAVTLEDGKYVSYETDMGFGYKDEMYVASTGYGATASSSKPPSVMPGVVCLISNTNMVVRPGSFTPGQAGGDGDAQAADASAHLASTDDPFQGYKDAVGDGNAINNQEDPVLLAAFEASMKDTALVILNKSEQEVKTKQARFDQGTSGVGTDELATMRAVAGELDALDKKIATAQAEITAANTAWAMKQPPAGGVMPGAFGEKDREEARAAGERKEALETQRRITVAKYPLLSRVDPAKFKSLTDDEMVSQLGGEMPGILSDIEKTRANVADGSLNLWAASSVVEATIAGFGLNEEKRKYIKGVQEHNAKASTISSVVLAVFSIGFGIAAAFTTGGASLFFAAGAFGLGTYDAVVATDQYMVNRPASNTAENKDAGLVDAPPGWGWLVVAWVGVGLDALDVVKAVKAIGKAEKTIAEGASELSKGGKLGMEESELAAKLRQVAGDVDGATKFGEAHKAAVSGRFGVAVDIDPALAADVRVMYEVEQGGKRVRITTLKVGPDATLAEVLAHERIVQLMRRYEGVTGAIRELWDRMLSLVGKSSNANPFPPGSRAYESWLELKKLPELGEARILKYPKGVGAANESALSADLEFLENERKLHQQVVDDIALESGAGFVAKTGDSGRAAVAAGYPLPPDITKLEDLEKSQYFYKTSASGDGTFTLSRKVQSDVKPLRPELGPDGKPTGKFLPGDMTRSEEAAALVASMSDAKQKAYAALKAAEEAKGNKVVPIKKMATTDQSIAMLTQKFGPADFEEKVYELVFTSLERKIKAKNLAAAAEATEIAEAIGEARKAAKDLMKHPITVIEGTDQLRAFGYRAKYLSDTGKATDQIDDLHHMIPLYLGGDHMHLVDLYEDLHKQMHQLVDSIKWDAAGTTLAPASIQKAALNFENGAAIITKDGAITYNPLNALPGP
ncbi:MAG: DUF4157 domain-containing protein [Deltaproteobacteria bacterium]|nr:DUF4157 domain-containing protein [Deltaproteobacteria bacterium]